jgi:hypothetical protein
METQTITEQGEWSSFAFELACMIASNYEASSSTEQKVRMKAADLFGVGRPLPPAVLNQNIRAFFFIRDDAVQSHTAQVPGSFMII